MELEKVSILKRRRKSEREFKEVIPDPVERLEILIDGSEDLGVKGLRARVARIEKLSIGLILLSFIQLVLLLGSKGSAAAEASGLLAPILKIIFGG